MTNWQRIICGINQSFGEINLLYLRAFIIDFLALLATSSSPALVESEYSEPSFAQIKFACFQYIFQAISFWI